MMTFFAATAIGFATAIISVAPAPEAAVPAAGAAAAGTASPQAIASAPDSTAFSALDAKLSEYLSAIERETAAVKCEEADFLIGSTQDSTVRERIAVAIYEHYQGSKVMGDEAVAIYVFDKWFSSGPLQMRSEADFWAAKMFAEFNRQSLIGLPAPELTLQEIDGNFTDLFAESSRRPAVLFFYDTSCTSCRADLIVLRHLFELQDYKLDFNAVYVGASKEAWEAYAASEFDFSAPGVRVRHFWDPGIESDYQLKYGVVRTPALFLIDAAGRIAGRRLDPLALAQLLEVVCVDENGIACEFGSEESEEYFDGVFLRMATGGDGEAGEAGLDGGSGGGAADVAGGAAVSRRLTCDQIDAYRRGITGQALQSGDTLMFRQLSGDLMYYLSRQRGSEANCALSRLIDEDILGRRDLWARTADSLAILPFAEILQDLYSRAAVGTKLPALELPAKQLRPRPSGTGIKESTFRLDKQKRSLIVFYTSNCAYCQAELAAIDRLCGLSPAGKPGKSPYKKILLINVDDILSADPETGMRLFDALDLTILPHLISTDSRARISDRYLTLATP